MEKVGTNDRHWHWTHGNSSAEGMKPGDFIVTNKYTTHLPHYAIYRELPKEDMEDGHG